MAGTNVNMHQRILCSAGTSYLCCSFLASLVQNYNSNMQLLSIEWHLKNSKENDTWHLPFNDFIIDVGDIHGVLDVIAEVMLQNSAQNVEWQISTCVPHMRWIINSRSTYIPFYLWKDKVNNNKDSYLIAPHISLLITILENIYSELLIQFANILWCSKPAG